MSKAATQRKIINPVIDQKTNNNNTLKEKDNPQPAPAAVGADPCQQSQIRNARFLKHFKKVYPLGIYRSNSLLSISSSFSSSLSQNSTEDNDFTTTNTTTTTTTPTCSLDQKIVLSLESLRKVGSYRYRKENVQATPQSIEVSTTNNKGVFGVEEFGGGEVMKRCHWITRNSDKLYVTFHDEQWGVPVYDDNRLFELLSMSGMLMDYNWTEILKRKELLRKVFGGFDPKNIATMDETDINQICSDQELGLADNRARCIVDNARAILKVVDEHGSFSGFIWGYFNYRPVINRYRHPRSVPLRSPRSEVISKDLIRLGFRLVGPVIVHSFMQCAGMSIDHLVDCFRYKDCVTLAENPWKHI